MEITTLAVGFGGIILGSILQSIGGYFTDKRAEMREHHAWLRVERMARFSQLLDASNTIGASLPTEAHRREVANAINAAYFQVRMVAPESLWDALDKYHEETDALLTKRQKNFIAADGERLGYLEGFLFSQVHLELGLHLVPTVTRPTRLSLLARRIRAKRSKRHTRKKL